MKTIKRKQFLKMQIICGLIGLLLAYFAPVSGLMAFAIQELLLISWTLSEVFVVKEEELEDENN